MTETATAPSIAIPATELTLAPGEHYAGIVLDASAKRLSRETGIPHHVDHIVPLQGDHVSGLHVESNLQVIPATDNIRKRNKVDPC